MATIINASNSVSSLQLTGDTSGILQLQSSGVTQQTIDSTGSYGQIKSSTAVASTSGTSIDFTSIPSWVKRITVMFNGVSTNGTSRKLIQLGSTTFTTTGYISTSAFFDTATGFSVIQFTTGFGIQSTQAVDALYGSFTISLLNSSTNTWALSGNAAGTSASVAMIVSGGGVSLSGVLDRVRITTVNGTDTFDAGSINILYEG